MNGKKKRVNKPVGLGAQIAEMLKIEILEGRFKGGEQLGEHDLQARFSVSRSPLREAFRELEKFGLVDIIPHRGSFVKRINRNDIEENFPVRAALEGLAAKLAHGNMTKEILARMQEDLGEMEAAAKAKDIKRFYTHHLRFHELFIERAENDLLVTTLKSLRTQSMWHRFSYQYYQEDFDKSFKVHKDILGYFMDPGADIELLRILVEHHINVALEIFLVYLENFERE